MFVCKFFQKLTNWRWIWHIFHHISPGELEAIETWSERGPGACESATGPGSGVRWRMAIELWGNGPTNGAESSCFRHWTNDIAKSEAFILFILMFINYRFSNIPYLHTYYSLSFGSRFPFLLIKPSISKMLWYRPQSHLILALHRITQLNHQSGQWRRRF